MYIVTIENDGVQTEIHGYTEKLKSGNVVKGINSIDSFSFSLFPSNAGFNRLFDFKTIVKVYNTHKNRYEFQGRVLYSSTEMNAKGLITKEVTCESFLGYLCDSQQLYVEEKNWTVLELLNQIITTHNSQVEDAKKINMRFVSVEDPNNNLYCGIPRENSWETLKKKLIDVLGGEIRLSVENGVIYLDYLTEIGEAKTTEIALSKNMKSIVREKDPTAYITRLIPLGAKLYDDGEERLTIADVNGGSIYLDDAEAIAYYGVHVGYVEFDDVTDATNLLNKAQSWLANNNKVQVKYSVTALDLSLLGLDIDDFDVGNYHPLKNKLLDIDDIARIIKKNIDICEEVKSTIEVGENFKTLSELQAEYHEQLKTAVQTVGKIQGNYVTNTQLTQQLTSERAYTSSLINQTADAIKLEVSGEYVKTVGFNEYKTAASAELALKVGRNENNQIVSMLNAAADVITIKSNRISIQSTNFTLSANGTINAQNATIEGNITAKSLTISEGAKITGLCAEGSNFIEATTNVANGTKTNFFQGDGISQRYAISTGSQTFESRWGSQGILFRGYLYSTLDSYVYIDAAGVTTANSSTTWAKIIAAANK